MEKHDKNVCITCVCTQMRASSFAYRQKRCASRGIPRLFVIMIIKASGHFLHQPLHVWAWNVYVCVSESCMCEHLAFSLTHSLSPNLFLSIFLSIYLSISPSLSLCLSICLSPYLSLPIPLCFLSPALATKLPVTPTQHLKQAQHPQPEQ